METNGKLLYEVSIIRPLVIFLLVIYHALCVYTGGWVPPQGVEANNFYWWMGHAISGFRIETIAFVGGYVFAYQCIKLRRRIPFSRFVWKKFKRLIIPCWIFGVAYLFLFRYHPDMPFHVCLWRVLNGIGHLWFLPMLFWCFLLTWCVDRLILWVSRRSSDVKPVSWSLLAVAAILTFVKMPSLRLGLTRVPHFFFYFYLGYLMWSTVRNRPPLTLQDRRRMLAASGLLAMVYVALLLFHCRLTAPSRLALSPIRVSSGMVGMLNLLVKAIALFQTVCGILALYFFVVQWLAKKDATVQLGCYEPPQWVLWSSEVCYGTYVFHAFFLWWLYYYTSMPAVLASSVLGAWMLPWIASLITFVLSVAATQLLLKTKVGRFLIG